jgi:predicted RND superfamily exporter protein
LEKLFSIGFWSAVARFILRNRIGILSAIVLVTIFMASQWQHMRFTYTEANLLPDDHPYNLEYNEFLDIFGEEGNLIVLGVKDSTLFTPENFNAWMKLSQELQAFDEVELSLSVGDLKKIAKTKRCAGI